jgi:D-alanine--poly(phosphoribitol) ligase subunit 1
VDLLERIDDLGHAYPDRLAHISGDQTLTYGELLDRSNRLAAYLTHTLPDDHVPIVIRGHKEPEMLIGVLGAVKARHPYIPIDLSVPAQRVERIITTANAPLVLTPDLIATLAATLPAAPPGPRRHIAPGDAFYIIFTSGSTGEPKGVVITLRNLTTFLDWMLSEHTFDKQGEVFLNQAPFSFDLSVMDTYLSLATGSTLFSLRQDEIANPAQLYRALARSGITVWVSTPSFAQLCLIERSFDAALLPCLRLFLFCGETLAPEVAAALLDRFPQAEVWNTYGPTETTVATTSVCITRDVLRRHRALLPVGYSRSDSHIVVLGEDGRSTADGERGEIVIASPSVSPGYIARSDLTARAFFSLDGQRAYHTGDWGYYQEGLLFCEGRRDNQIKLHGHRIELGDVEANLQALSGVRDAVIVPKLRDGQPDWLGAFVILSNAPDRSEFELTSNLKDQLAQRVPAYMIPRKFYYVTSFPLTANGKADRRQLAERLA